MLIMACFVDTCRYLKAMEYSLRDKESVKDSRMSKMEEI